MLLLSTACGDTPPEVCLGAISYARPPQGGACQEYGDSCAVPEGHVACCRTLQHPDTDYACEASRCVDDPLDDCAPDAGTGFCQRICI